MKIGLFIDNICSTRSALFMGLPLLLLGRFIQKNQNQLNLNKKNLVLFFIDLIDGNLLISPRKCL